MPLIGGYLVLLIFFVKGQNLVLDAYFSRVFLHTALCLQIIPMLEFIGI